VTIYFLPKYGKIAKKIPFIREGVSDRMSKIKRIAAWLLVLVFTAALLAGCGGGQKQETEQSAQMTTAAQTQAAETEEIETEPAAETEAEMAAPESESMEAPETEPQGLTVEEDGTYTSKEEVALYIHTYGRLPSNYVTKKEAQAAGWDNKKGNLQKVIPGASIGGDRFGNYEGLLPEKKGRKYYECDINYEGGYRGAERIIYSNDGLIYYTEDHYESFEVLYE
jgi:guanyl-specific ribonuclease Sa